MYIRVGNFEEIMDMNYWRFMLIIKTMNIMNAKASGKPVFTPGLPQSNKDMIAKRKAQR